MNKSLLNSLRDGGYILYTSHGEATIGVDQPSLNFSYCFTQRNLSDMGRIQSLYYGKILYILQIPISYPVIVSPFCRTIETAQLAFGYENIQVDPFWLEIYKLSGNLSNAEQKNILDTLEAKLEILPPQESNKVIVGHSFPEEIGLGSISHLEAVIIKPKGEKKGYEIISKLSLSDLLNLPR